MGRGQERRRNCSDPGRRKMMVLCTWMGAVEVVQT